MFRILWEKFVYLSILQAHSYVQYSSQVMSPAGTREYHNGAPREAPMLTCHAQDLRVTAWITTSHASIFTHQQGPHKDQPAPRPAKHSSLRPIVASHLRTIFIRLPGLVAPEVALIISSNCPRLLFWRVCMDLTILHNLGLNMHNQIRYKPAFVYFIIFKL